MAVIATDKFRLSHVIKNELFAELAYCRAVVTVNDSAATLAIGTVLGKVTAGGKYKRALNAAVDGSQVADAIVINETVVPAATDTSVLVMLRGPASVNSLGLVVDASYTAGALLNAVYASLEAKGIQVLLGA